MTPEFSRRLAVTVIKSPGTTIYEVAADAAEREAVASRLRIPAVLRLACRFRLEREGHRIRAHGDLAARVVQTCVVSLEAFEAELGEAFEVVFTAVEPSEEEQDDNPLSPDFIVFDGAGLDLGEAAVEQLALALDPFPRSHGACMGFTEGDAKLDAPFAALEALRRR